MTVMSPEELSRPFVVDRLLEIRTSRMKKMPGLEVMSGIDKKMCLGPMKVSKLGLEGDEHDPTFHGGPDKAILGCEYLCSSALSMRISVSYAYSTPLLTRPRLFISLSRLASIISRTPRSICPWWIR